MPVAEEDKDITTFTSHTGMYWFNRVPFGHMNAPAKFQPARDILFNKFTWKFFMVYIDDIIIFSIDNDQHLHYIENMWSTPSAADVLLKMKKFQWLKTKVERLSHTIASHRLSITRGRIKGLRNTKHQRTLAELKSFFGISNVYLRFVGNYSHKTALPDRLLKQGQSSTLPPLK